MKPRAVPQWSDFWQQGFVTTFGPGMPDNYQGVIADFWGSQFERLADGARLLDIATGNGAVAILAARAAQKQDKTFAITGCDLATISPQVTGSDEIKALRGGIHFRSNTACERLPFEKGAFDFICSQFGLEYCKIPQALGEIRRVLVPGGKFVAIAHHSDSNLLKAARSEAKVYRAVLKDLNLFGRVRAYFGALGNPLNQEELRVAINKAKPLSTSVNEGVASMKKRYPDSECAKQILAAINSLAQGAARVQSKQRLRTLAMVSEEFEMAGERLEDMVKASLDGDAIDRLHALARTSAFSDVSCQPFMDDNRSLAGWHIELS
ncbi:MAG: class I SAM-dependent methyltransferase [Gammaproteobacteria bacterium]|nr:class I SAM-dependent methyltransferase [Gammaproteobacteria bacterium]